MSEPTGPHLKPELGFSLDFLQTRKKYFEFTIVYEYEGQKTNTTISTDFSFNASKVHFHNCISS